MADACAHCGLPLGRHPVSGTVRGADVRVCCFGCLLALQITGASGDQGVAATIVIRLGLAVFFTMNVMMVSMPSYVPQVYGDAAGPVDGPLFGMLRVLAMLFTLPVLALLGGPIVGAGWRSLRAGSANGDLLIVLATAAAVALSIVHVIRGDGRTYFDTAAMLLVLVTLGRWFEAKARADAGAAIRTTLAPPSREAVRLHLGLREPIACAAIVPGDLLVVGAGDAIPVDGVVVAGRGGVDQAMLTGESAPVTVEPGSTVHGGTCSADAQLTIRATATVAESAAARIERLVTSAAQERSAAQRLADRVSALLVPVIALVAIGAGAYWTAMAGIDRGVLVGLAVLVVACPCALGIATPVAAWVGLAAAAGHGVVVRGSAVLERLAGVRHVLFDKTGTLTERHLRLRRVEGDGDLLALAAALERDVRHPLAQAIVNEAAARGVACIEASDVRVLPGRGVSGLVDGRRILAGSAAFAGGHPERSDDDGPVVVVASDDGVIGVLRFGERIAPGARQAVASLRDAGIAVEVLTGDGTATAVVPSVMMPNEAHVGLLPEDKLALVRALHAGGGGPIAMVGDGINDAPAQALADVGIAVAGASDLTRLGADVVVLGTDLRAVPWVVAHARRVVRVMRQNLAWAFGYNAVAVALAAAGALTPLVAALAMLTSSAAVVANARRLRGRTDSASRSTSELSVPVLDPEPART